MKKYIGDTIVGKSTDTKPTNIIDGARFFETDTKKSYIKDGGIWVELGLDYTPEDSANKKTTITDSSTDYPTTGAVKAGLDAKTEIKSYELEIEPEDWEDDEAVMEVVGITPTNIVWIAPHPDSYDDYIEAGIRAITQDEDELTFSCEEEPEETIKINIVFENVT